MRGPSASCVICVIEVIGVSTGISRQTILGNPCSHCSPRSSGLQLNVLADNLDASLELFAIQHYASSAHPALQPNIGSGAHHRPLETSAGMRFSQSDAVSNSH